MVVWKVRVVVLEGVLFGSVFGLVFIFLFVEVREVLVCSGLVFRAEVMVEVVSSVWVVQMLVQKKQQRVGASYALRETHAS